jgi:CubicO group peptidase (beta-lactamase class C family)
MRRLIALTALGAVALSARPAHVAAQSALPDSIARRIDAVYAGYASRSAPGCVVGVFQNGRVAFARGYGSANIEYDAPITPGTPFIMGSVSKQFTAAAIALLIEDGRIKPTDDVRRYIPELRDYGKTITIDNLVHHTSGLRDFWTLVQAADMRNDDGYSVGDVLRLAARQRNLNFDPGAEYNYSNTGYVLLGIVVERVTGKTLRQFAAERIFEPLGMTHSHFHDDHTEPDRGRASAYSPAKSGGWKINVWNNDIVGQGGLMTTIGDLQKWDENFYTGRVGGKAFLARQLDRGVLNDGKKISYAYGLQVLEYRGLPMVEHSGSTGGYRTDIARFPTRHTSVATMCNLSSANAPRLAHAVADILLSQSFTKPAAAANAASVAQSAGLRVAEYDDAGLRSYVGRYYSDELDATYEITKQGGALMLKRARSDADTLRALRDVGAFRSSGLTLRFEAGQPGSPMFTLDAGRARGIEFRRMAPDGR